MGLGLGLGNLYDNSFGGVLLNLEVSALAKVQSSHLLVNSNNQNSRKPPDVLHANVLYLVSCILSIRVSSVWNRQR